MKKIMALALASTILAPAVMAQDAITEFNVGILGGENA